MDLWVIFLEHKPALCSSPCVLCVPCSVPAGLSPCPAWVVGLIFFCPASMGDDLSGFIALSDMLLIKQIWESLFWETWLIFRQRCFRALWFCFSKLKHFVIWIQFLSFMLGWETLCIVLLSRWTTPSFFSNLPFMINPGLQEVFPVWRHNWCIILALNTDFLPDLFTWQFADKSKDLQVCSPEGLWQMIADKITDSDKTGGV